MNTLKDMKLPIPLPQRVRELAEQHVCDCRRHIGGGCCCENGGLERALTTAMLEALQRAHHEICYYCANGIPHIETDRMTAEERNFACPAHAIASLTSELKAETQKE